VVHEVTVTFDEKGQMVLASGFPLTLDARVRASAGDKIRWTSPHGKVTIRFKERNPFGGANDVEGDGDHELKTGGSFEYLCALRLAGSGKVVGWSGDDQREFGGKVEVEVKSGRT
jgi:hypothetical protein